MKINRFIWIFLLFIASSCGIVKYSFTGTSIDSSIKTVTISQFVNTTALASPMLAPQLSERLRDKFVSSTNIKVVQADGDIKFEGVITSYTVSPAGFTGTGQTTAVNRLSITVNVKYTNTLKTESNWEQTFTRYADFDGTQTLSTVESKLLDEITKQLAEDIFNKTFVNW